MSVIMSITVLLAVSECMCKIATGPGQNNSHMVPNKAPRTLETVWLKDVTTRFQTGKRTLSDLDLPNELTFHLSRGSETLSLNLQRNYDINPNADIYFVRTLKDGQSVLAKTRDLEKKDVAYYQDRENGAFMTVRCVKKSNDQCDRLINGNIRIGDSSYDLRPADTDVTSRNVLQVAGLLGKRYVLEDQTHIQGENSVKNKDAAHVNENKLEQEVNALLQRLEGQHKQNRFPPSVSTLSSRNVTALDSRGATDKSRELPKVYHIKVAVLIDSGIWDLFSSMFRGLNPLTRRSRLTKKIREYFSHIMNGINLCYKTIPDRSVIIGVVPAKFILFQQKSLFPHRNSKVTSVNGITYIEANDYLTDIGEWDLATGSNKKTVYDNGMMFTGHKLYRGSYDNYTVNGLSYRGRVCDIGKRVSVVGPGDYNLRVKAAAHELGHSLGAYHDGHTGYEDCKPDDFFIMAPRKRPVSPSMPYLRNPWIFSTCTIRAFKKELKNKECVKNWGKIYDDKEYADFLKKLPGEVYTINEQCQLIHGPNSVLCETPLQNVCHLLRCTDPKTKICLPKYFGAARGTACGPNRKSRGPSCSVPRSAMY